MRALISGLLLLACAPAMATTCHYFWTSDCFEIRDASRRDITHHVLVSGGVYTAEVAAPQCDATQLTLSADHMGQVLKRFNKALKKLDGCKMLDALAPKVFDDAQAASAQWRRLQRQRNFKQVHEIRRLPED